MPKTLAIAITLVMIFFSPEYLSGQPPPIDIQKQVEELKLELEKVHGENASLRAKLYGVDYDYLNLKLRDDILEWSTRRVMLWLGGLSIFAIVVAGLLSLIGKYYIRDRVREQIEQAITREVDRFRAAANDMENTREEVKALSDEMRAIHDSQTSMLLATGVRSKDLVKYLPLQPTIRALRIADHQDLTLIQSAIQLLGAKSYDDPNDANAAVEAISRYLASPDQVTASMAVRAFVDIGNELSGSRLSEFLEALLEQGLPRDPSVVRGDLRKDEERLTMDVATALGDLGWRDSVPLLKKVALDTQSSARAAAVRALAKIGNSEARALVAQIIATDDDKNTVLNAVNAAGEFKVVEAIPPIARRLESRDRDWFIHDDLAKALGQLGTAEALYVLLRAVSDETDPEHAHTLVHAVLGARQHNIVSFLRSTALSREEAAIKCGAVMIAGIRGGEEASELLRQILDNTSDAELQHQFLEKLEAAPVPGNVRSFIEQWKAGETEARS